MDILSLSEYATQIEGETIAGIEDLSLEEPRTTERQKCVDCNKRHIPRRFVYCVDGTWMVEDGPEGYYRGLGARQPKWKKYWQGGSSDGYEELIAEVYEHCAKACCPSQDELLLFGYSRGAFVVRAVAGLFNGLGTLKRGTEGWDDKLAEGMIFSNSSRTCLEAWFLGFHADMGGGLKEDGLSLWPLQWILSEAARYGLSLEFQVSERLVEYVQDPMEYTMPGDNRHIPFKNGATVRMWDLNEMFNRPNFQPAANKPSGLTAQLSNSERQISTNEEATSATIVHPSVFWADDMTPLGINFLNPLTCASTIRQAIKEIDIRPESLYWNLHHTRVVDLERSRPRVLICGPSGVGKSTLVNEILGQEVSLASSGLNSVRHEIDTGLTSTTPGENGNSFTFHDANGFERGYCCSSVARLEEADREFIRSASSCGVPFIVVFTNTAKSIRISQHSDPVESQPTSRPMSSPAEILSWTHGVKSDGA
ncbi:hypothetical protein CEP53_002237 [Fusarium sp. AF-6]|nr:hypothetical protein CEP53_002237 [Fusarium sp. AF-6]